MNEDETRTRLFFMVDSLDTNEEIFETLEEAEAYYAKISPTRYLDDIGDDNKRRICIVTTEHAFKEDDGSWSYDDAGFDTFENIKVLETPSNGVA